MTYSCFQKDLSWVIDLYHDLIFEDSSMYPSVEDVMDCLKEKEHMLPEEEIKKLDPDDLKVDLHIRERRNRKNGYIKKEYKQFQETHENVLLYEGNGLIFFGVLYY